MSFTPSLLSSLPLSDQQELGEDEEDRDVSLKWDLLEAAFFVPYKEECVFVGLCCRGEMEKGSRTLMLLEILYLNKPFGSGSNPKPVNVFEPFKYEGEPEVEGGNTLVLRNEMRAFRYCLNNLEAGEWSIS